MSYKFKQDNNGAREGELFILSVIKYKHPKAYRAEDVYGDEAFSDCDIFIPTDNGKEIVVEVKQDTTSRITRHIAVEFEYNGKPSGLAKSKADFWAFIFWDWQGAKWVYAFVDSNQLHNMVSMCKKVGGGDYMASKMYLMPTSRLLFNPYIKCKPISKHLASICEEIYEANKARRDKKTKAIGQQY